MCPSGTLRKPSVELSKTQHNRQSDSEPLTAKTVLVSASPPRIADFELASDVAPLHRLGQRAFAELLAGLGRKHLLRTAIDVKARRYLRPFESTLLSAVRGNRFSPASIGILGRGFR
jgi:hypothetical protein